jgi:hypothetical protein
MVTDHEKKLLIDATDYHRKRLGITRGKMSTLLQEADAIAGQDRSRDYGHPYENHRRIAEILSVQLGPILSRPILPREVALMMIGLKLAREVNSPKRDNLIDACGYAKCVDMIDELIARKNNGI